jgi:hypothetical protein
VRLNGQVACEVFQDAMPALSAYTLRKRKETFDWINELTRTLIQVWAVHTQRQAEMEVFLSKTLCVLVPSW